jgi:GNAT superfamily N-acetyltransferase
VIGTSAPVTPSGMRIRTLQAADRTSLHHLLRRVEIFEPHEVDVAEELIDACLSGSDDYLIYVAEQNVAGQGDAGVPSVLAGFVCHGHNPVTDAIHDIYWIAVDASMRRRGVGRGLLQFAEHRVRTLAGRGITIETSCRPEYRAARRLYEECGYETVAEIADFYKPCDAMRIYMKRF